MSNIRPLNDQVLVQFSEEKEEQSPGGIIIPQTAAKERPHKGVVKAVGPGKLQDNGVRSPMFVAVGNHVVFGRYSGTEVEIDSKKYTFMSESEILAVVD